MCFCRPEVVSPGLLNPTAAAAPCRMRCPRGRRRMRKPLSRTAPPSSLSRGGERAGSRKSASKAGDDRHGPFTRTSKLSLRRRLGPLDGRHIVERGPRGKRIVRKWYLRPGRGRGLGLGCRALAGGRLSAYRQLAPLLVAGSRTQPLAILPSTDEVSKPPTMCSTPRKAFHRLTGHCLPLWLLVGGLQG